ncbi:MAG: DUF362 domain-containing protein [Candidatus Bathyarchaeia archaeon]
MRYGPRYLCPSVLLSQLHSRWFRLEMAKGKVAIVRLTGDTRVAIEKALKLLGGLHIGNLPIYIKPNLCAETDVEGGANVSSLFLRNLIALLLNHHRNASIKIIESDSSGKNADRAFEKMGYTQLVEEFGGGHLSLVNLSKEPTETIDLGGLYFKSLTLPRILLKPHYLITVAKAKTHGLTEITGALKNQFGCLPNPKKSSYHPHINEVIVDLNKILPPSLCIVDGSVCMEGVTRGKLWRLGVVICGYDPVAVDATLTRVMGLNPFEIKHLLLANREGLGIMDPSLVGEPLENVAIKVRRPSLIVKLASRLIPDSFYPLVEGFYRRLTPQTVI